MVRTFNTLFVISSVDGKISTGDVDGRDFDKDFPKINGLKEGLRQYYELEKRTDIHSFNTGRVMSKIGVNTDNCPINCPNVGFIIADNHHLNKNGLLNLIDRTKKIYIATSNKKHPAFNLKDRLEVLYYPKKIDFQNLFKKLRQKFGVKRVTIQSGGTMNSILMRNGLIDRVSLVIAPAIIGGKNTSSLVDGKSLRYETDLKQIKTLKLIRCEKLKKNYLHLVYSVTK